MLNGVLMGGKSGNNRLKRPMACLQGNQVSHNGVESTLKSKMSKERKEFAFQSNQVSQGVVFPFRVSNNKPHEGEAYLWS